MADTFTAVDLSKLPAPTVVEPLDYETIYGEILADFLELDPDFDATVESDPVLKLLQVAALRELTIRARVNDAAKAVMVAFARDGDLDHLAALFGVRRLTLTPADPVNNVPAVMENDPDLRRRILLAPEGYSVAGPEGAYIYHALSAASAVLDASATSPEPDDIKALVLDLLSAEGASAELVAAMTTALDNAIWPGQVIVSVLSREGDGTASPELVETVNAYLSDETRRPLTDFVTVQSAAILSYAIIAALTTFAGPDSAIVLAQAQSQVEAYVAESLRLGRDITRSGIFAALHCPGVQNVVLTSPAADLVCDRNQAAHCTGITLTHAGVGE
ncbi:MAG TPA: baseplate J/gp47 family protein [Sphingobium sp.]|uniref:baseplate assembly protein n=1 Tax=Sphingobium sp. TaxID=1912891 RepID=UPI002ED26F4A